MTLISVHHGSSDSDSLMDNSLLTFKKSLQLDCEYIGFAVQLTKDKQFVVYYDDYLVLEGETHYLNELNREQLPPSIPDYQEVLQLIKDKKKAEINFKLTSPDYSLPAKTFEVAAVKQAIEILGVKNITVSSCSDASVTTIRSWSRQNYPDLLVGLMVGQDTSGLAISKLKTRFQTLNLKQRLQKTNANLLVVNKLLARKAIKLAGKADLPVIVWKVNDTQELTHWLNDSDVWMIVTDHSDKAYFLREAL